MPVETRAIYEFGPYRLDGEDGALTRDGQPVHLPPKAVDVLLCLLERHGTVVSKRDLSARVWPETTVVPATLNYQIHVIRRALQEGEGEGEAYIETVPSRGFRFVAAVVRTEKPEKPGAAGPIPHTLPPSLITDAPGATRPRPGMPSIVGLTAIALLAGVAVALPVLRPPAALRVTQCVMLSHDRQPKADLPLLLDADHVYYSIAPGEAAKAVPIHGGESSSAFPAASDFVPLDVNSRQSEYLAHRVTHTPAPPEGSDLWILPAASGTPHRVGTVRCWAAAWSSDGRQIVYISDNRLYVVDRDGTAVRALPVPAAGAVEFPRFSPDGRVIRFTLGTLSDRTGVQRIWEINTDGSGAHRLLPDAYGLSGDCCGAWSRTGEYFVFQAIRDNRIDLWVLPTRTGLFDKGSAVPIQLTNGPLRFTWPTFGPDDQTLFAVGTQDQGELVRYDMTRRELVPYLGISGTWITYSPDRQWIAYVSFPDRTLWRARLDGTSRQQLTSGPFDLDGATWSPDGRWIAFRSRMAGKHLKIYVMPAGGGEPRALIAEDEEQGIPTWSGDGTRLAFGEVPSVFGQADGGEVLHVYDLQRRQFSIVPGSAGLWTCRWSPDGRSLAALTIAGQVLMVYDFDQGRWRSLGADHVNNPTWSSDGRYIYYDTEGDLRELRRVRVADGHVDLLADLHHYPIAAFWWSGLAPDDSPIVLRSLSGNEVYALRLDRH